MRLTLTESIRFNRAFVPTLPFSQESLADAVCEVIRVNRIESEYLRPIAFF